MRSFTYVLILVAVGMLLSKVQPAYSGEEHQDIKLIGSWTKTVNSTDSSGNPCPFVPDTMEFFKDQTMIMSNFGSEHLPYKSLLTPSEKLMLEERNPDLKGKNLLLIKPDPSFEWVVTPMVYGYSIEKNELTLNLKGWPPAKFIRVVK